MVVRLPAYLQSMSVLDTPETMSQRASSLEESQVTCHASVSQTCR